MRYEYNSDITKIKKGIIAHGVNCQKAMGSGVAKALYTKWKKVRTEHLKTDPVLGSYHLVLINGELVVCNCYTQEYYGRDPNIQYASYSAIETSLIEVISDFKCFGFTEINIPKIGCGYGGLNWMKVKEILLKIESDNDVEFIVHLL